MTGREELLKEYKDLMNSNTEIDLMLMNCGSELGDSSLNGDGLKRIREFFDLVKKSQNEILNKGK